MSQNYAVDKSDLILVTGAAGFIGVSVVQRLLEEGFRNLRCFVRPFSQTERLNTVLRRFAVESDVETVRGDLVSREHCASAARGVSVIYHLAAGFDKSFAGAFMNSAIATRNLMDAFLELGEPKRFVNVSSFAVYSTMKLKRGASLDEDCPLEDAPQDRYDAYAFGKLMQEELVRRYGVTRGLPYVILRPGTVYGPGKKELSGRIGIGTFGFFIHLGGSNLLPLTYVDNCADAIVLAGVVPAAAAETFNVVDDELLTSRQFLRAYKRRVGSFFSVRVPYPLAYALCALWEKYSNLSRGQLPPAFNRRRCSAEWKGNRFPNRKLREQLGWRPRVGVNDGMSRFLGQFPQEGN
jgi:nucleoside-diphosphate-sugar epimerase